MTPDPAQQFPPFLVKLLAGLFQSFLAVLQHGSTLYWPFLLSTLVVAILAWKFFSAGQGSQRSWREFRRLYLGRALWWHPSARVDYRYYLVNAMIFPLLVGPALVTGAALAGALDKVLSPLLGAAPALGPAGVPMRLLYTLVFFIAYDFGRFVAHSLQHEVPVLWEFHKVHHSAEVLTPITAFRAHPLDLALMAWGSALATGLATWGFQRVAGVSIGYYEFLQLHVLLWAFGLMGNLKHWQVRISYGPVLDRWLISPAHHQLHHSAAPRHFGCNRGFEIALWDRLYGTLCLPRRDEEFALGLGDGTDGRWHRVWRLYCWPVGLAARRLLGRGAAPAESPVGDVPAGE